MRTLHANKKMPEVPTCAIQEGPEIEPEPETRAFGTFLPGTDHRCQGPKPEPQPHLFSKLHLYTGKPFPP